MALPIIGSILSIVEKVIDRAIPDPKQKAEALVVLAKLEQDGDLAAMAQQVEINKLDAASNDNYQRRARPTVMWVCAAALAIQMVVGPLVAYVSSLMGRPIAPPIMETELLTTLLVGMLGLGGMRTVEKLSGKH